MSKLDDLKAAKNLEDFSYLLGYRPKSLAYIIYQTPDEEKYKTFSVTKKSGGEREICAPQARLKALQSKLALFLEDCCSEIEISRGGKKYFFHGFRRDHSIITNARLHRNRRYVLNLDIADFFPSINFGRVYGFFAKDTEFALEQKICAIIAQIACFNNALPQGSPCSPIISNLVGHLLDVRLARLAKINKCTYSRYADDLTFSTNQREFPEALASQPGEGGAWELGAALVGTINRSGFEINAAKTRMQLRVDRQMVTGLIANKKVNVRSEYYRFARSMCHALFTTGEYRLPNETVKAAEDKDASTPSLNVLEGILGHIYYVREGVWRRKIDTDKRTIVERTKDKAEHNELSATGELYWKFLFYRRFVCPEMPVIIGEGKTDNAYLRAAMRKLAPAFPSLMDKTSGLRKVQLFNYSRVSSEVLRLGGGSDQLKNFICNYAKNMSLYKAISPTNPVIIVIDNDKGANGIFGYMQHHKPKPSLTSTEPFYHIGHNLYLVKTPEIGAFSCMEDLFPTDILGTKLDGKTFNISNTECTETQYGKHAFAENVVKPKIDTIDFSGFTPLLERIAAAIADYTTSPT